MSVKTKKIVFNILLYICLAVLVVVSLFPLAWAIFGSLKESQEMYNYPYDLLPKQPTFNNYKVLFNLSNFFRSFTNTALTSIASTAISLVVACLSGYSLTRFTFPGSKMLKRLIMDVYMIPTILLILPVYSILTKLGLRDNLIAYTVMVTSTTLPFCVWLMTSYFAGVSMSFEEAGMIDGCSRFQAFVKVVVPQLTPAIIATGSALLSMVALIQPFQASQFIFAGALRGAGDTKFTAMVTMLTVMLLRPGMAIFFINQFDLGLNGAWYALVIDQLVRTSLVFYRYHSGKWTTSFEPTDSKQRI